LSAHVKALEEELGTRLFDRLGRSIETTRAGELLYRHGRRILAERDSLLAGMDRFLNRVEGRLHLGASTIPGEYILPRVIASFRSLFPLVRVELQIADTTATVDAIEAGRIDLGFVGARLARKDLRYEPFATDRIVLVAPATRRWEEARGLTVAELRREALVVREEGSGSRLALERGLRKLGTRLEELNVVAELGSTAALKEAVRAELAIAFLSSRAVAVDVEAGSMRILGLPRSVGFERAFYTVRNTRRSRPPIEEEFLRHLRAYPAA
jgi:DNA-binding transcriptional LysR family regulator